MKMSPSDIIDKLIDRFEELVRLIEQQKIYIEKLENEIKELKK